jgi:hypothetical protein
LKAFSARIEPMKRVGGPHKSSNKSIINLNMF